jgi:predicted esterase
MGNFSFKNWLKIIERPPKIMWITGMNSSGEKPRKLALMGYEVLSIGTTNNYFAAYLGRLKRYNPFFKINKKIDKMGADHIEDNLEKQKSESENFMPDVIVGTSQGGAVAMKLGNRYPNSKFILGSPAWKIFNSKPINLPKDTIVIHGRKDVTVPLEDSVELVEKYGFDLKVYNFSHSIPLSVIRLSIDEHLADMGMQIPAN